MTECLFARDGMIRSFDGTVTSCEPGDGGLYAVQLSRTAFFPGGGGQSADVGELTAGGVTVRVVGGRGSFLDPIHLTDGPLPVGEAVHGEVDFSVRLPRMQSHTGEHILCGVIHGRWGFDNVGFHLADSGEVTVDLSGEVSPEDLRLAEDEANRIVTECRRVTVSFPKPEELSGLSYRSKLELTENVRLVTVEGCDTCACCAPHVPNTGMVGLIKIVSSQRWKGGVRLTVLCGARALADYRARVEREGKLGATLSSPAEELEGAVGRLLSEKESLSSALRAERACRMASLAASLEPTDGDCLLIEPEADGEMLRAWANPAAEKCRCAVAVAGRDGAWRYVAVSLRADLSVLGREMNGALNGRGGGRGTMISGTFGATREELIEYFGQRP